ncbi:hypothetical protein WKI68_08300 [Streptomyces sp. MS1.HAVA.3]|uniref:Uncharacterized protein n=1 Tax=Streptomyces caledonius TaxID=3134107 RepID=A0ABU8U0S8_9ACTN
MARREPNGRLRTLLADARWSGQDFARAVNGVAAETGLTLRYDRTSISHWLAGTRPPAHVVALAAEALSRRTGRRVSPADTGLARPAGAARARDRPGAGPHGADALAPEPAAVGAPGAGDAAAYAESLLGEIPVYSSAWRPPGWPPPQQGTGTPTGAPARPTGRIGPDHVEAAEAVLPVFRNADMMFGSGLARPALTRYLATTVAPGCAPTPRPRYATGCWAAPRGSRTRRASCASTATSRARPRPTTGRGCGSARRPGTHSAGRPSCGP